MSTLASGLSTQRTPWSTLAVAAGILALVYSIWYAFAAFLPALVEGLNWSRGETSLAFSILALVSAASAPMVGVLLRRVGIRRLMAAGAILTALGLAATSQVQELWQFYLVFGVVTALGVNACGWIPCVSVLQGRFGRSMGLATGLASSGTAASVFLFVPTVQLLINGYGWRTAFLVMAAGFLILVLPLTLLLTRHPPSVAGVPRVRSGDEQAEQAVVVDHTGGSTEWSLGMAIRTWRLWFIFGMMLMLAFALQMVLVHQIAFLTDRGLAKTMAALVAGSVGLVGAFAKPIWGFSSDRYGREFMLTGGAFLSLAALAALWWLPGHAPLQFVYLYVLLMGIGYSIEAPLGPAITADLFPGRNYGSIFSVVSSATFVGSAAGAWLGGYLFDRTGSYLLPFSLAAIGIVMSLVLGWLASPRSARLAPASAGSS